MGGKHLPGLTICLGTRAREEEGKGKGRKEDGEGYTGLRNAADGCTESNSSGFTQKREVKDFVPWPQ